MKNIFVLWQSTTGVAWMLIIALLIGSVLIRAWCRLSSHVCAEWFAPSQKKKNLMKIYSVQISAPSVWLHWYFVFKIDLHVHTKMNSIDPVTSAVGRWQRFRDSNSRDGTYNCAVRVLFSPHVFVWAPVSFLRLFPIKTECRRQHFWERESHPEHFVVAALSASCLKLFQKAAEVVSVSLRQTARQSSDRLRLVIHQPGEQEKGEKLVWPENLLSGSRSAGRWTSESPE